MEQLMIYGLAGMTLLSILLIFAGLRRMAVNRESSIKGRLEAFGARNAPAMMPKQGGEAAGCKSPGWWIARWAARPLRSGWRVILPGPI